MKEAFAEALGAPVDRAVLLAGGASKEAWAVDSDGRELLIRRAAGGVIHQATLSLEQEFEVLRAAHEAGVKVPEPITYLGDVEGRAAIGIRKSGTAAEAWWRGIKQYRQRFRDRPLREGGWAGHLEQFSKFGIGPPRVDIGEYGAKGQTYALCSAPVFEARKCRL